MPRTKAPPAPEDIIGTARAAKLAGVAQHTINHWIRTGRLKARVTPTGYRFPASRLYDLLSACEPVVRRRKTWRPKANGGSD